MPIPTSHWLAHAALHEKAIFRCKSIVPDGTMTPPGVGIRFASSLYVKSPLAFYGVT